MFSVSASMAVFGLLCMTKLSRFDRKALRGSRERKNEGDFGATFVENDENEGGASTTFPKNGDNGNGCGSQSMRQL